MHKYINKNNYEIIDDIIEVDSLIAKTISILNQKGYNTLYCCSGHVKDPRVYEKYQIKINEMSDFPDSYIVDKTDEYYTVLKPYSFTSTYIKFDKDYKFNILPNGFTIDEDNVLEKIIEFYDNGIKRKSNEIQEEINKTNEELLNWALELNNIV